MRILIVGSGMWPWYEPACAAALSRLGCDVAQFATFDYFHKWVSGEPEPVCKSISARLQNRLLAGPILGRINRDLLETVKSVKPDIVFLYNTPYVYPETVDLLRVAFSGVRVVQYANDNPFSPMARKSQWRHFVGSIPKCDINLAYRAVNIGDFTRAGARAVHLLRSYYIRDQDRRMDLQPGDRRFASEMVFAGHFEDDGRLTTINKVLAAGIHINVFGGGWSSISGKVALDSPMRTQFPIKPVVGDDYRKAISGAKIALCFLSKLNGDSYTRRNFQIPAMGTFMLSQYSDDLSTLFKEGEEAEFFRSSEELIDKARFYLNNEGARNRIARGGQNRLLKDGHEVGDRMKKLLQILNSGSLGGTQV